VEAQIEKLRDWFGLTDVIFVGDRVMLDVHPDRAAQCRRLDRLG